MDQINPAENSNQKEEYRYRNLYQTPGDVNFIVGRSREQISAHKVVLIHESGTFEKYFSLQPQADTIIYDKMEPESFKQMLSFVYRGHCDISSRNLTQLYHLGYVFSLRNLLKQCARWLMEDADLGYVVCLYAAKHRVAVPGLDEQCARVIRRKMAEATKYGKFYHMFPQKMQQLLAKIEEVNCNYGPLMKVLTDWRKHQAPQDQPQCNAIIETVQAGYAAGRNFGENHGYETLALIPERPPTSPYYEGTLKAVVTCRIFGVGLFVGAGDTFPRPARTVLRVQVLRHVDKILQLQQRSGVYDLLFPAFTLQRGDREKIFVSLEEDWPPHPAGGGWYESSQRNNRCTAGEHLRLFAVHCNFLPVAYVLYETVEGESEPYMEDSFDDYIS